MQKIAKEPAINNLVSWFSNFVSWQGATNAHSLSSVIEERRSQGAKGQTKWVSYLLPAPKEPAISCRLPGNQSCYFIKNDKNDARKKAFFTGRLRFKWAIATSLDF